MRQIQACCNNLLWVALSHYNRQVQMPCPNTVEQLAPATWKPHRGPNQASTLFRRLSGVFLLITKNPTAVEESICGTSWARRYCFLPGCLLLIEACEDYLGITSAHFLSKIMFSHANQNHLNDCGFEKSLQHADLSRIDASRPHGHIAIPA